MTDNKKLVYRAGMIPYIIEDNQIKMMFMIPSNSEFGGPLPQIAKGKVEYDEDYKTAAIREAKEELGLFVGNVVLVEEVGLFMGRTTVFVSKIKDVDMFGLPEDETESTQWLTMEQFMEQGRSLHQPVVQSAYRKICKIENIESTI